MFYSLTKRTFTNIGLLVFWLFCFTLVGAAGAAVIWRCSRLCANSNGDTASNTPRRTVSVASTQAMPLPRSSMEAMLSYQRPPPPYSSSPPRDLVQTHPSRVSSVNRTYLAPAINELPPPYDAVVTGYSNISSK